MGLALNRSKWQFKRFDGTFLYEEDNFRPEDKDKGMQRLFHKKISIERLKGIRGSFRFNYQISEFYNKIASGDKQAIIHAFILLGFFSCAVFTFLAVGIGLVNGGSEEGWYFIGLTMLIVIFLIISHRRQYRKSQHKS